MQISKRLLLIIIVSLVLLLLILPYIFIPSDLSINNYTKIVCTPAALSRAMNTGKHLAAFNEHTDSSFTLNGYTYKIVKKLYNASAIEIKHLGDKYESAFSLIPLANDTSVVKWETSAQPAGSNPFSRLLAYKKAVALKQNMEVVLQRLKPFMEMSKNVYGYAITRTTLTDTDLVSIKKPFKTYPAPQDIYKIVDELKIYIAANNATVTNYPMLNVTYMDSVYMTMVAVPVNKVLPASGSIVPKHLVPITNKILTTEVHGGTATIKEAYRQIELFMTEHSLSAPVIPFEQMITDRTKEADSTRWVTRIFYPVV